MRCFIHNYRIKFQVASVGILNTGMVNLAHSGLSGPVAAQYSHSGGRTCTRVAWGCSGRTCADLDAGGAAGQAGAGGAEEGGHVAAVVGAARLALVAAVDDVADAVPVLQARVAGGDAVLCTHHAPLHSRTLYELYTVCAYQLLGRRRVTRCLSGCYTLE